MRFVGLTATEFSMLFASAAFLAVLFYLLSFRRRTAVMAAEPIWRRVLGRRRTPFRKLLALLGQILILFLLTLARADPRLESEDVAGPVAQVLVVDVSASMGALEHEGTRLDQAIELAEGVADALGPRDRLMLMAMDDGCRPSTHFSADAEAVKRAARSLRPVAVAEDFERAVHFAASALRTEALDDRTRRRITVVSDRFHPAVALDQLDQAIELLQVAVGTPGGNLAVTAFDIRRRGGAARGHEVFCEVTNFGRRDRRVKLSIHTSSELLGEEDVDVPARGSRSRSYFLKPVSARRVMATITGLGGKNLADRFQLDDRAYALIPRRESRRVLLVTTGNLYLEKALQLDPSLEVDVVRPADFGPGLLRGYQAVVFEKLCPAVSTPAIYFAPEAGPASPECPFSSSEAVEFPELLPLRGDHPITEGVTLVDVQISSARRLVPSPGDVELLADGGGPLVLARQRNGRKLVAFGFDVARSDLPLRIAFPLMMHNCLVWFLGQTVDLHSDEHAVGGLARLPEWVDSRTAIVDPRGRRVAPLTLGGRSLVKLRWPGFYEVGEGRRQAVVPANFHLPDESSLAGDRAVGKRRLVWSGGEPPEMLVAGFDKNEYPEPPLQWPLVLLAVAWLLLFDWVFFCFRILF